MPSKTLAPPFPAARRTGAIAVLTLALSLLAVAPAVAAPTIGGTTDAAYTEGSGPTLVATDLTIADGLAYGGQYLEFSISGATTGEALGLADDGVADTTNGVVSIVNGSVYLGNGSTADNIGSVDETLDGTGGSALRINFTSAFTNSGFETGDLTGWTPMTQQIDLGSTSVAGCPTLDTSTYPGPVPNQDNNIPITLGSLTTPVVTSQHSEGTHALQLVSSGMTTQLGYDVVHGPAIYSDPFEAAAGDTIYFDWRAYAGSDNYHVFGYIIDDSCNQTELLDATGPGTTAWTTKPTVIPASGTYRFVFVSGTFDASGGQAAGASLYIDNVQVFGTKASDAVAQAVARKVTYYNTDEESAASRTLDITAQSAAQGSASASLTINVATDPAVTTSVSATPGDSEATLTWTAPDPGSSAITDYVVQRSSDSGSTWQTFSDGVSTATSTTVTGLTNGTEYIFQVAAVNAIGAGPYSSASNAVTPASVPGAPGNVIPVAGDEQVDLSWDAPSDNGGSAITDYVIQYSSDGGSTWQTFADGVSAATSTTVTGLTNGTEYVLQVAAVNGIGTSPYSTQSGAVKPVGAPLTPNAPTAAGGDTAVTLSWSAPNNGGSAITDYVIQYSSDGGSVWQTFSDGVSTDTIATVTGLDNGTEYTFRIAAINAQGTSPYSSQSNAVAPATVPAAPENLVGSYGNTTVDLSWDAPGDDGGSAVTDYVIEYSSDGGSIWQTFSDGVSQDTSATVTGLDNGTEYVFRVAATNAEGTSTPSAQSGAATPRTVAGAANDLIAVPGPGLVALAWNAPAGDGGSAITDYLIQYSSDGGSTWQTFNDGTTPDTGTTVTGLDNGIEYVFRVYSVNSEGTGPLALSNAATPTTVPAAPGTPDVSPGAASVELSWAAPDDGGTAITDYLIQYSSDGGSTWHAYSDDVSVDPSTTVSGLDNGTGYVFEVAAVNAVGVGDYSPASELATPTSVPGTPSNVVAVAGNKRVDVAWDAPDDGGLAITDYIVEYSSDGATTWSVYPDGVSDATTAAMAGLSNNTTYVFRVSATNSNGTGPFSGVATATPFSPLPQFDDAETSVFSTDIKWIRDEGITVGCNPPLNSDFCPETPLTRAQMASFLDRWLDFAPTSIDFFTDDDGNAHEDALNRAKAANVFRGCNPPANDLVCPDEIITRGEAAAALVRALGLATTEPVVHSDTTGHLFEQQIGVLGAYGITRGCNPPANDQYCPDLPVTRGQMAAMLHRASAWG